MGQRIISLEKKLDGSFDSEVTQNSPEKLNKINLTKHALNRPKSKPSESSFTAKFWQETVEQNGQTPKLQAVKFDESKHQHQATNGELNSFDKASELLKNGMCEEDVAKRCELSSSETALMAMVVKKKTASI